MYYLNIPEAQGTFSAGDIVSLISSGVMKVDQPIPHENIAFRPLKKISTLSFVGQPGYILWEVEPHGEVKGENSQYVRLVRTVDTAEYKKLKAQYDLNIELLKRIQTFNRYSHIGGSYGLWLNGLNIVPGVESDIDIVLPFFQRIDLGNDYKIHFEEKTNSNDFDYSAIVARDGKVVKLDVVVDPKMPYNIVNKYDFNFRVSDPLHILKHKLKYALKGEVKHSRKILEMMANKATPNVVNTSVEKKLDLPF